MRKHFRLAEAGPAWFAASDAEPGARVVSFSSLPRGRITLWLCLDPRAHEAALAFHAQDTRVPGYSRGFYDEHFPEPCVLLGGARSTSELRATLADWVARIRKAYAETS